MSEIRKFGLRNQTTGFQCFPNFERSVFGIPLYVRVTYWHSGERRILDTFSKVLLLKLDHLRDQLGQGFCSRGIALNMLKMEQ